MHCVCASAACHRPDAISVTVVIIASDRNVGGLRDCGKRLTGCCLHFNGMLEFAADMEFNGPCRFFETSAPGCASFYSVR